MTAEPPATPDDRRNEIAANLDAVERRVTAACASAGRSRDEVTLVAVTKTFPAEDVGHLAALGVRDVGESRHQDAAPKVEQCRLAGLTDLRWHFVGQLQTNKAAAVAGYADVVHSVDRRRLVDALARGVAQHGRAVTVLVQVDLAPDARVGGEPGGRGGAAPDDVPALAAAVETAEGLVLGGVMAVAPLGEDPAAAFARLASVAAALRATYPHADMVSAGMSADLEPAVQNGATHLRVGTALLGSRPPLR